MTILEQRLVGGCTVTSVGAATLGRNQLAGGRLEQGVKRKGRLAALRGEGNLYIRHSRGSSTVPLA
jgi:hypothetical protein